MGRGDAPIRLVLLVAVAAAAASVDPLHSAAGARTAPTNFRATFMETKTSVNRVADLGVFQLINTASGTVDGYGPATVVSR